MNETCSIKQFEEKNKKEIYTNEKVREIGIIFPSTINFSCSSCYSSHIDINKKLQQQQYEVLEHWAEQPIWFDLMHITEYMNAQIEVSLLPLSFDKQNNKFELKNTSSSTPNTLIVWVSHIKYNEKSDHQK